jgi:hypothetical protein
MGAAPVPAADPPKAQSLTVSFDRHPLTPLAVSYFKTFQLQRLVTAPLRRCRIPGQRRSSEHARRRFDRRAIGQYSSG